MGGTGRPRGRPKRAIPVKPTTNKRRGRPPGRPTSSPSDTPKKRGRPKRTRNDEPSSDSEANARSLSVVDGRKRRRRADARNVKNSKKSPPAAGRRADADNDTSREIEKSFVLSMVPGCELSSRRRYMESWRFACKPTKVEKFDAIVQHYGTRSKIPFGIKRILEGIGDQAWICKCCFEDPSVSLGDCLKIIDPSTGSRYFEHHLDDEHPNREDEPPKKPLTRKVVGVSEAPSARDSGGDKAKLSKKKRGRPATGKGRAARGDDSKAPKKVSRRRALGGLDSARGSDTKATTKKTRGRPSKPSSGRPRGRPRGCPRKKKNEEVLDTPVHASPSQESSNNNDGGSPQNVSTGAVPQSASIPTFDELTTSLMMDDSERFYFQDLAGDGVGKNQQQATPVSRNTAFSNLEPFPAFLDDDHMMVDIYGPSSQEKDNGNHVSHRQGRLYLDSFVNTLSQQQEQRDNVDEGATHITNSCSDRLDTAGEWPLNTSRSIEFKTSSLKQDHCEDDSIRSLGAGRLDVFISQQAHCLKCDPTHFIRWLHSEDIHTLHDLSEAIHDPHFVSTDMKAHGLKGFKHHVFANAIKFETEKRAAVDVENEQSSSSSSLTSTSSLIHNNSKSEDDSNDDSSNKKSSGWFGWVQSPLKGWLKAP